MTSKPQFSRTLHDAPFAERRLNALVRLRNLAKEQQDSKNLRLCLLRAFVSVAHDVEHGSRQWVSKTLANEDAAEVSSWRCAIQLKDASDATERGDDQSLVAVVCVGRVGRVSPD